MSRASSKEEMPFLQLAKPHRREPLALLLRFLSLEPVLASDLPLQAGHSAPSGHFISATVCT